MRLADQILALFEEAMDEYERLVRLELERVGLGLSRWLAALWQRLPCDDWRPQIERIFANLERDHVFVDEESRKAFIAWLEAVNAEAKERVEQISRDDAPLSERTVSDESLFPPREQVLRQADEQHFPGDLPSPCDLDYPQLRRIGNGIMQSYPPDEWLDRAERALTSYRVPEEIRKRFLEWIAAEQQKAGVTLGSPAVQLAFAEPDIPPAPAAAQSDGGGLGAAGAGELHWIPFERHIENEGILVYKTVDATGAHWWKLPVKKIMFEGREVYDLRGAAEFHPTFVQSMILEHDGVVDDKGLEIILRHYLDRYGSSSQQQLLKDLASQDAVPAFKKFARAQATELLLGLLVGKVAEKLAKIGKPAIRKAFEKVNARIQRLAKGKKPNRQQLEKELREIAEDLRNVAKESADAETKKTAQEIADQIEADGKQAAQEVEKLGGKPGSPRLPAKGTDERKAIEKARKEGIRLKQQQELDNILAGGKGSGIWTDAELEQIRKGKELPDGIVWHHDPTVANRPDLAADPATVHPVRGGKGEHLERHGGDWRKPYPDDTNQEKKQ